jgi:hypothetical protein
MSRKTLAQILKDQDEVIRCARADASGSASPIEGLQQGAWDFQNSGFSTPVAPQGYSGDDIQRMYLRQPPFSHHYVPHFVPTPPATDSTTERAASPPIRFDARAQVTILACLEHGTDLRTWPASARAFLAPTETLTIRLQYTMGATHCEVKVPKFPFLAVSPGYRPTRIPEQEHLTLPCSPDGKLTVWAIEWIGAWLQSICNSKNDGPLDIPIPDTSMGWAAALELRVTAIELGLSQYITHIEDAWLAKAISMQMMCDDGPLIFETAREEHVEGGYDKTDRLLVALCNRHKEGLWEWDFTLEDKRMWYETFTDEERSVVRDVGRSGRSIRQTRTFSDI